MYTCPRCKTKLNKRTSKSFGLVWECPSCRGRAMTLELLRKAVSRPVVNRLWHRARSGQCRAGRTCPACRRQMTEVPIVLGSDKTVHLDVCISCHFVWFDAREFETLPKLPAKPAESDTLSAQAKEALALARLEALKHDPLYRDTLTDGPDHWWEFAVALTGVPVEYNDSALRNRPVATWSLAAIIAVVSIAAMSNLEAAVQNWGLVPAELRRHLGLTFITSFFLHVGLSHLIGNLYFLVVFGDNTEDVLGKCRFLLLVALAAVFGDITHILVNPGDTTPCVGASGGISGVLAYYCLRFPTVRVGIVWWFHWLRIPVWIMFLLWVLWQVSYAVSVPVDAGGVAVFAHLGGAGVGIVFWLWTLWMPSAGATTGGLRPENPGSD